MFDIQMVVALAFILVSGMFIIRILLDIKKNQLKQNDSLDLKPDIDVFKQFSEKLELKNNEMSKLNHEFKLVAIEEISDNEIMLDLICDKKIYVSIMESLKLVNTNPNVKFDECLGKFACSYIKSLATKNQPYMTYIVNIKSIENENNKRIEVYKESLVFNKKDFESLNWECLSWSDIYNLGIKNFTGTDLI